MLHLIASLAFAAGVATPAAATDTAQQRREDLMTRLRSGGYTVLLRHARTDYSFKEEVGSVPKERSMQRNLSDDGIRDAALMGVVFRKYGVSFAEVISSPMFRCVETAEMAFSKPTAVTLLLRTFPTTAEQGALVKTAPKAGTNRLLVTHHFVIETHVPGVKPGDVAESEAAIVKHSADGTFQLVGIIKLDDWKALANPGAAAQASTAAQSGHGGGGATHGASATPHGASAQVPFPDTHAGHVAHDYIDAFNTGDPQQMRAFTERSMVANPSRSTDERVKGYVKLFDDFGPLSLVSVDTAQSLKVTLKMTSKRGAVIVTVTTSDAEPMKAASVTFGFPGGHS